MKESNDDIRLIENERLQRRRRRLQQTAALID